MKPFRVFNYIWNLQWPCLQRQLNWKHVELTLNPRKVNTRGDTQTRPLDTPSRGGFPNFACTTNTHNCCQNYFTYFFFLLSSLIFCCFCCVVFGISFVDIWHKDYVILPERGRATFVSGFRLRLHSHVGFGVFFRSVKNRCALSKEINDKYVLEIISKNPKISSQYFGVRLCCLSWKVRASQRNDGNDLKVVLSRWLHKM